MVPDSRYTIKFCMSINSRTRGTRNTVLLNKYMLGKRISTVHIIHD